MGFFSTMLHSRGLEKHDKPSLWNYQLSDLEFHQLLAEINQSNWRTLDIRDCALYYAEWWKRNYNGGIPSKEEVFNSLGKATNAIINPQLFFEKAKFGAQLLGVKWIEKYNTLYFRTLLLQGGLPLRHISANKSSYQKFLLALLELQPDSVEEIELLPNITKMLPASSRNHVIYENCLAVVRSVLRDEDFYANLFGYNTELRDIHTALQIEKARIGKRTRENKPKIFWVLKEENGITKIFLQISLAAKYSINTIEQILGLEGPAIARTYRLYLDDKLVCSFRRTLGEEYKTEWERQSYYYWQPGNIIPQFYWESENERKEIDGILPVQPSIDEPTLWAPFGENEWRLVKGTHIDTENALLVFPITWYPSRGMIESWSIDGVDMCKVNFEGEISITNSEESYKFFSNVESFDWYIKSERPTWMRKSDLVIVTRNLKAYLYDSKGYIIPTSQYKVFYRSSKAFSSWRSIDNSALPLGLIEVKIEYNGITAYDRVYNIGELTLSILDTDLLEVNFEFHHLSSFNISLVETDQFTAQSKGNKTCLQLDLTKKSIPETIQFKLKLDGQRALNFDIITPFSGVGLVDKDGIFIPEHSSLTIGNLQGIRLLTAGSGETVIRLYNKLRDRVKISKEVQLQHQPLISYKDDLFRLFYLADSMKHDNVIELEIFNGTLKRCYSIRGFSHTVTDISGQLEGKIKIDASCESLQLLAVPVNSTLGYTDLINMEIGSDYNAALPSGTRPGQFIIVSPLQEGRQLQPRFINTDPDFVSSKKNERLETMHTEMLNLSFDDSIWKELFRYYKICLQQQLPFSTFDQIRAIALSSKLAARAFFFLAVQQEDMDEFIQFQVKGLEQDIGFCFHWINKQDWQDANAEAAQWIGYEYIEHVFTLMAKYFQEQNLDGLYRYLLGKNMLNIPKVTNQLILEARAQLGPRVLSELPDLTPAVTQEYSVPVMTNSIVKILLRSPIAVAESIKGISEKSLWTNDDFVANLRRNIQYAQFIAPDLYTKVLYHCLTHPSNN